MDWNLIAKVINSLLLCFTLLWGCGLKCLRSCKPYELVSSVSPSYEGVDWNWVGDIMDVTSQGFTLLWGCGLKWRGENEAYIKIKRFTLLWGCGLKWPCNYLKVNNRQRFTLLWGCGLKYQNNYSLTHHHLFHPLMRVWIEINIMLLFNPPILFHPLMRVWIEICLYAFKLPLKIVSPSYEGVDWNILSPMLLLLLSCFTLLWGCGLK